MTSIVPDDIVIEESDQTLKQKRLRIALWQKSLLEECRQNYLNLLTEQFFIQHDGNYVEFGNFKKRPSKQLQDYLEQNPIIPTDSGRRKLSTDSSKSQNNVKAFKDNAIVHSTISTPLQLSVNQEDQNLKSTVLASSTVASHQGNQSRLLVTKPGSSPSSPSSISRLKRTSRQALSDVYEDAIGSQEEILERAKQEAVVQRRVAELRKQGLWSQRRLPKVQEPPRNKTHWDYLLEEMRWLAADFAQERKWKRAAARKLVRTVANYHKDAREKEKKAEKEGQQKLRRTASNIARQIRVFWSNIGKVVEYKQQCLLDEKRQKALDLHLNFIVDQTSKYSDWLTQGLNQTPTSPMSKSSSRAGSDDEFLPQGISSDDEETIAVEEEANASESTLDEVAMLKQESELPFADLLSQLPSDLIENIGKPLSFEEDQSASDQDETNMEQAKIMSEEPDKQHLDISAQDEVLSDESEESIKPTPISLRRSARKRTSETDKDDSDGGEVKKQKLEKKPEDEEFDASGDSSDDETTVKEQEDQEKDLDHEKEIQELQAEGDMPIEELLKLYGGAYSEEAETSPSSVKETNDRKSDDEASVASESKQSASSTEDEDEIGMDYLLNKDYDKKDTKETDESGEPQPNKEITDVAAEAMNLQPTGHTLATTQVATPIPHLLRHTLREYQHIGLDWLVTMFSKRLNGILADEMGLGKTIQTIALLAHLACEKGVWGPHLIVVPTSVMLNWEMEFKKWCPGFKILTYYGSQKERKLKRTGWTKSNAFHVCITSYKLVVQDHASFRRKKWRYLILDEAQNIKNFKSQRWQALLNFNSQRRLLLTGTPLQNNLMELWSLMHFLMPQVFQSHREFKEWFSNPMTGMIEGFQEFNEKIVRRLHKVLRPFLLRRVKKDVEKQMPNKYEHVVKCHLSKRQRFLYEDFMSKASTKDTLAGGHFMSVINVLMQLRKVCNHPNLFEPRQTVSPFVTMPIVLAVPTIVHKALDKDPLEEVDLSFLNLHLPTLCELSSLHADSVKQLQTPRKLIEEIHSASSSEPESSPPMRLTDRMKATIREKLYLASLKQQELPTSSLNQSSSLFSQKQTTCSNNGSSDGGPKTTTAPQARSETDISANAARSTSSQSITLQYQTAQGTRWATIPNGQIRHLPGGVVQIVTSGVPSRSSTPIPQSSQTTTKPSNASDSTSTETVASKDSKADRRKRLPEESYSKMLVRLRKARQQETVQRICRINERRCEAFPSYLSANTIAFLQTATQSSRSFLPSAMSASTCRQHKVLPLNSSIIEELKKSPETRFEEMQEALHRFVFVIPKVASSTTRLSVAHQTPWKEHALSRSMEQLRAHLSRGLEPYHSVMQLTRVQFPEARLIEYDCGKLQILNVLLRRFWAEKHRILIFTQMTRVLDILEAFLSYHGYRYLRLDGSTQIEQRMARMERFNNDPRIFCFILSTRSGGIGVNLTGADTVVFYDSDWNPTMDAQAQDRCHRIGQTRDVHIYRLISERTVEENILKKANQKRLLGNLAIEGGSFTTAFFKHQAIKDLFDDPSGLEELAEPQQRPLTARQKAIEAAKAEAEATSKDEGNFEEALLESEDKEDAAAAKLLRQEQDAVMEEFTESEEKPTEENQESVETRFKLAKGSKYEEELNTIYDELNPVERYALRYLELTAEEMNDLELKEAEEDVNQSKKDWELQHLIALKEEEERRMEDEEDEIFYTRYDAENQMYVDELTGEVMPIWYPPTPPHDEQDLYFDSCMSLLYVPIPMTEEQLPPVSVRQDRKRPKHESTHKTAGLTGSRKFSDAVTPEVPLSSHQGPRKKLSRLDVNIPKSLFHRPLLMLKKKDTKPSKFKSQVSKKHILTSTPTKSLTGIGASVLSTSPKENGTESSSADAKTAVDIVSTPDWIINEDWALLQAVQQVLDMPLTLATMMPAHTPNWHLVADIVNVVASGYRSPKQCKQRFEGVVIQREEGKGLVSAPDPLTPKKKMKGFKLPTKTKLGKPQKTSVLYMNDTNQQFTSLYSSRFDACKTICNKRNPPSKNSSSGGQLQRNPKHTNMLHEYGITYDKPLHPMQVAAARAKRIASQKKPSEQSTQASQGSLSSAVQSAGVAVSQQVGNTLVVPNSGQLMGKTLQVTTPGLSQLTAIPLSGAGSNIVVNSSFTRRVGQQQAQNTLSIPATASKLGKTSAAHTLRTISGNSSQLQIQQQSNSPLSSMSLTFASGAHSPLVTITTAVAGSSAMATRPTITYPPRSGSHLQKLTSMQQIRQVTKQQAASSAAVKQQVKQLRVAQSQPTQDLTGAIVSAAAPNAIYAGKKVQVTKVPRTVTQQELQMLMKRPQQMQIAPIQAQLQAQQVRSLAAQQASEQINTSKPLPITVPVTNLVSAVNLTGLNVASSTQPKSMIVTPGQATLTPNQQLVLQQHLLKQRQQQQSRQVIASKQQKGVYATVASHHLATTGTTTVKMTPQIQAQMLSQLVAQQQKQRRTMAATSKVQQPVTLTVTKLLQTQSTSAANTAIRHTLVPQSSQIAQQVGQMQLSGNTTMVTAASVARQQQQQRIVTPQRQQMQSARARQHSATGGQPVSQQLIVASAPAGMQRPPVIAIGNPATSMQVHPQIMTQQVPIRNTTSTALPSSNITLQVNTPQTTLQPSASAALQKTSSPVMSHVITISGADGALPVSTDNQFNLQQPK